MADDQNNDALLVCVIDKEHMKTIRSDTMIEAGALGRQLREQQAQSIDKSIY